MPDPLHRLQSTLPCPSLLNVPLAAPQQVAAQLVLVSQLVSVVRLAQIAHLVSVVRLILVVHLSWAARVLPPKKERRRRSAGEATDSVR